jgi:molybdopterin converting factor small subunit
MQIYVHLFSILREHLPPGGERGRATVTLPEGATVADLIAHLGIARRVRLAIVNGAQEEDRGRPLQDGDYVKLFPAMVGG